MQAILRLKEQSTFLSTRQWVEESQKSFPARWVLKPVGVELEITNKCNLRCEGCAQQIDFLKPADTLSVKQMIATLRQLGAMGVRAYSITGGEMTMFLGKVLQLLSAEVGMDVYKLNTNGYRFVSDEVTRTILLQLRAAGFGVKNTTIVPVLVMSLGQQTKQGIPLMNGVHLARVFYEVFRPDEALVTFNVTDQSEQDGQQIVREFKRLYRSEVGKSLDDTLYPMRIFGLTNLKTLNRLGIQSTLEDTLPAVMADLKRTYKSWKCLNMLPEGINELPSLTPRIMIRPNGDVYACPGYNYVHKIGNLHAKDVGVILEEANMNPILRVMFTKGLPGLIEYAKKTIPTIEQQTISISATPCDVCELITRQIC